MKNVICWNYQVINSWFLIDATGEQRTFLHFWCHILEDICSQSVMKLYCKNNCKWQDLFVDSNQLPKCISSTFILLQEAIYRVHVSDPAVILCNFCFPQMLTGIWWDHSGCVHGQGLPCGMLSLWGRSEAFSGSGHLIVITPVIFNMEINLLPYSSSSWPIQTLQCDTLSVSDWEISRLWRKVSAAVCFSSNFICCPYSYEQPVNYCFSNLAVYLQLMQEAWWLSKVYCCLSEASSSRSHQCIWFPSQIVEKC